MTKFPTSDSFLIPKKCSETKIIRKPPSTIHTRRIHFCYFQPNFICEKKLFPEELEKFSYFGPFFRKFCPEAKIGYDIIVARTVLYNFYITDPPPRKPIFGRKMRFSKSRQILAASLRDTYPQYTPCCAIEL